MENRMYIIHERLEKMPRIESHIREVDLRRNEITEMAVEGAASVEYLDLSDNRISAIEGLDRMPGLKILDMSYNLIRNTAVSHRSIEELYLISNDIAEMPCLDIPNVRKLDIAVNSISRIENLEGCTQLEELYLGGNRITVIEGLTTLGSLRILDLQNNCLETVDCSQIPRGVETLLLADNRSLRTIRNIELLTSLKVLGVERTAVSCSELEGAFEIWR